MLLSSLQQTASRTPLYRRTLTSSCGMCWQVFGAFLLPFLLTYRMQLRSRRHWRRGLSKRPTEPPRILDQGSSSSRGEVSPDKHPGLDIRPTWALFLPESLAFLMLCFVAGQDPRMLQYMV
jgi:hypothetical protein